MEDGLDTGLALGMILSCHDSVSGCGRARWASAASFFLRLCVFASSLKSGLPLKPSHFLDGVWLLLRCAGPLRLALTARSPPAGPPTDKTCRASGCLPGA